MAGHLSSQFIALISAPIITRLFTPNDYGIMIMVGTVVSFTSIFACMRYETAIIIEKDRRDAISIMFLCFAICTVSTSVAVLICYIAYSTVPSIFGEIGPLILTFILIGYFMIGIEQSLASFLVRDKIFHILGVMYLTSALITVLIKISYGYVYGSNPYALLLANIPGVLLAIFLMIYALNKSGIFSEIKHVNYRALMKVAKRHNEFPKYQVSNSLLNSAGQNTIVLLLSIFFTPQVVGLYGLSQSVLQKPIKLIGDSFSNVYLQNVSELQGDMAALSRSLLKSTLVFAAIGIVPFGILTIWGKELFGFVFGNNWSEAGVYTQILAPWIFTAFINNPARQMIILLKRLRFNFLFQLYGLIVRVATVVVLALVCNSVIAVLIVFSLLGVFLNLFYIMKAYQYTTVDNSAQ